MLSLEQPIYGLVEDYLKKCFDAFNSKLDQEEQVKIYVGRVGSNFTAEAKNTAVINLYAVQTDTIKDQEYREYSQDVATFYIDIFVSPKIKIKEFENLDQDELAHKMSMVYTQWVRSVLTDLSVQDFGKINKNNVYFIGDFHFLGLSSYIPEYTESEQVVYATRMKFTLDLPYYPTDSTDYNELKQVALSLGGDINLDFNYGEK